jgi:hypothetical protein
MPPTQCYLGGLPFVRSSGFTGLPHLPAEPLENIKLTDLLEIPADCIKSMESMISD